MLIGIGLKLSSLHFQSVSTEYVKWKCGIDSLMPTALERCHLSYDYILRIVGLKNCLKTGKQEIFYTAKKKHKVQYKVFCLKQNGFFQ